MHRACIRTRPHTGMPAHDEERGGPLFHANLDAIRHAMHLCKERTDDDTGFSTHRQHRARDAERIIIRARAESSHLWKRVVNGMKRKHARRHVSRYLFFDEGANDGDVARKLVPSACRVEIKDRLRVHVELSRWRKGHVCLSESIGKIES